MDTSRHSSPTITTAERLANEIADAIEAIAARIPQLEAPHPSTATSVRGARTVSREFIVSMIAAVVFDGKALTGIKEIGTAQEATCLVVDGNLDLRPGKPGEHEQHAQSSLHSGLGFGFDQGDNSP